MFTFLLISAACSCPSKHFRKCVVRVEEGTIWKPNAEGFTRLENLVWEQKKLAGNPY